LDNATSSCQTIGQKSANLTYGCSQILANLTHGVRSKLGFFDRSVILIAFLTDLEITGFFGSAPCDIGHESFEVKSHFDHS
jgi:hypothetical protein